MFEFYKDYMEFFFIVLIAAGLILALIAPSAVISYILILLSGLAAGRLVYERKNKILLPYLIIIAGFLVGYLIGMRYGDRTVVVEAFLIGSAFSYYLFEKKVLNDTRF